MSKIKKLFLLATILPISAFAEGTDVLTQVTGTSSTSFFQNIITNNKPVAVVLGMLGIAYFIYAFASIAWEFIKPGGGDGKIVWKHVWGMVAMGIFLYLIFVKFG